ncbi:Aspartic peptidase domain containing protein [Abeliophyllum distichum]|uniref:Aspartic peptidase domain containing protein n=1 Tax=Abeliophyllum distichum TaxID=126358 RepID=A0ABD1SZ60_9LAMI
MAVALSGRAPGTLSSNIEINPKKHVKAITTRSGVQLPEIHVKRSIANKEVVTSTDKEHVEQTEQTTDMKESSGTPQVKKPFLSNHIILQSHFLRGASINLMPLSIFRKLGLGKAKATMVTLQLANRSIKHPRGVVEDLLVKVDTFIFPADFIILDMEEDKDVPLLLGRPFLATDKALIDVQKGQLILRLSEEHVTFDVFKAIKYPTESNSCLKVDVVGNAVHENFQLNNPSDLLEACIVHSQSTHSNSSEVEMCARYLEANPPYIR